MKELTWEDRYNLCLKERLSIREIVKLLNCGQPFASKIRKSAIKYCNSNNLLFPGKQVPTDAVMAVTNRNTEYYYNKMMQEKVIKERTSA